MTAFPSLNVVSLTNLKINEDSTQEDVVYPSLKDFLAITQLVQYKSKLVKLKCVEVEDLLKLTGKVGFLHVELQRLKRYVDYFNKKILVHAVPKSQPISLENFCTLANLPVLKQLKKAGVVEFDDLPWLAYGDLAAFFPKKIELYRFKRYIEKISKFPEPGLIEAEGMESMIKLKGFYSEVNIKALKSAVEKLGVMESDDLFAIVRSDLEKLSVVEFERFVRHREKLKVSSGEFQTSDAKRPCLQSQMSQETPNVQFFIQKNTLASPASPTAPYPSMQQPPFNPNFQQELQQNMYGLHPPYPVDSPPFNPDYHAPIQYSPPIPNRTYERYR